MLTTTIVFSLFLLLSLSLSGSILIGIPGGWLLLLLSICLDLTGDKIGLEGSTFGWNVIGWVFGLLVFSEVVELIAGMLGTRFGGGSKKGMWASFWGALLGAILGTFLIPIPLIGSILGSLLGAFTLAYLVESKQLESPKEALRSAIFGTIGRLLGTLGKFGLTLGANILLIAVMVANYF